MSLAPNYLYLKIIVMVTFKSTKIIKLINKALMPPGDPYIKHIVVQINYYCMYVRFAVYIQYYFI